MNIQKQLSMDLSKGSLPGDENAIVAGPQLPSLSVIPSQVDASSATLASLPIDICYNLYSYLGRVEIQILALASATSTSSVDGPANANQTPGEDASLVQYQSSARVRPTRPCASYWGCCSALSYALGDLECAKDALVSWRTPYSFRYICLCCLVFYPAYPTWVVNPKSI